MVSEVIRLILNLTNRFLKKDKKKKKKTKSADFKDCENTKKA